MSLVLTVLFLTVSVVALVLDIWRDESERRRRP